MTPESQITNELAVSLGFVREGDQFILETDNLKLILTWPDRFQDNWQLQYPGEWGDPSQRREVRTSADLFSAVFDFGRETGKREVKTTLRDLFGTPVNLE